MGALNRAPPTRPPQMAAFFIPEDKPSWRFPVSIRSCMSKPLALRLTRLRPLRSLALRGLRSLAKSSKLPGYRMAYSRPIARSRSPSSRALRVERHPEAEQPYPVLLSCLPPPVARLEHQMFLSPRPKPSSTRVTLSCSLRPALREPPLVATSP